MKFEEKRNNNQTAKEILKEEKRNCRQNCH